VRILVRFNLTAVLNGIKVIQYDSGARAVLNNIQEFEVYIFQNNNREIQRWRQVRLSFRALEGQQVAWPYEHIVVSISPWL
jgi:hypothetical protein